jgi:hypothetical protein
MVRVLWVVLVWAGGNELLSVFVVGLSDQEAAICADTEPDPAGIDAAHDRPPPLAVAAAAGRPPPPLPDPTCIVQLGSGNLTDPMSTATFIFFKLGFLYYTVLLGSTIWNSV